MGLGNNPSPDNDPEKHATPDSEGVTNSAVAPLEGLRPPPRSAAGSRARELFASGTAKDYAELSDILYSVTAPSVLSYIGYRLALEISPRSIQLARDLLRLCSMHATGEFLSALAQRERNDFLRNRSSALAGNDFAGLRQCLADLAMSPSSYFSREDWYKRNREVETIATFPLTIIRRCAGSEVDATLVSAATRGGIDPDMNRRALDLLTFRESSNPTRPVLEPKHVASLCRVMEDVLREPFNRMQVVAFVDQWLSKNTDTTSPYYHEIQYRLLQQWFDYSDSSSKGDCDESLNVLDTLSLLRHFKSGIVATALSEASNGPERSVSLMAHICSSDPSISLTLLNRYLDSSSSLDRQLAALRVFAFSFTPELDLQMFLSLREHAAALWIKDELDNDLTPVVTARRVVLLQSLCRRLFTEAPNSPTLLNVFGSLKCGNNSMAAIAANLMIQPVIMERALPLSYYDSPEVLESLQIVVGKLTEAGNDPAQKVSRELVQSLQEHWLLKSPAAYGFELSDEFMPGE